MIERVGFIGVGTMGEPMAANLLKAGFRVTVAAHRNRAPVERLLAAGATEAPSVADVARAVQVLVSCVSDDAAVEAVMLGPGGVADGAQPGLIVVDTSTISPMTSQRLAARLAQSGVTMLDAPISGGQVGAIAGTLAIMVGGDRAAFEAVLPVLEGMGKNITYIGQNGAALVVKLCNNLIGAAIMTATSEAFAMAAKAGIDTGVVHQVLCNSTARGWLLQERFGKGPLVGNLQPGFKLRLMHKDMGLALETGKALGVPMFSTALVHQLFTQAMGLGKGDLDSFGISQLYTEATGVSVVRGQQGASGS
ncbi:MAG: NAD(P)-dependent oxidoreductase [Chloroflexota bacterium]